MKNRVLCTIIALATAICVLSGCGEKNVIVNTEIDESLGSASYPLETDEKLTWWTSLNSNIVAVAGTMNETAFAKALIEKTGVDIEFVHPALGQEKDQFNLMIASRSYPDIIEYQWKNYPGGVQMALDDEVILPINELIDKVAPNMKAILEQNPLYKKGVSTTEGQIYAFPFLMDDEILATYYGPILRGDILEQAGLSVPETIEEWEIALKAFKDAGIEVPLVLDLSNKRLKEASPFLGAFGVSGGFFVDNGTVKYGPYEDGFVEFVKLMRKWYQEGLLDSNFTDTDEKRITALMAGGNGGATFCSAGGQIGKWVPALKEMKPGAYFTASKYPVLNKGERPQFGQKKDLNAPSNQIAISATCANPSLAAKVLDYGYSEEGHMFYNFGIEGESYNMVDGKPVYTDIITDPSKNDNKSVTQAMAMYMRSYSSGPFSQDVDYIEQYYQFDEQKNALKLWKESDELLHKYPSVTYTAEENDTYVRVMTDIETYQEETMFKTITGLMSMEEFEKFHDELKSRGIEDLLKICQTAYDRYME